MVTDNLRNKDQKQQRKTTRCNAFIEIAMDLGMVLNKQARLSLLIFGLTLIP